eukprot:COSAG02_NODE_33108_length_505_cov_0.913793_1_plen_22_part_10
MVALWSFVSICDEAAQADVDGE